MWYKQNHDVIGTAKNKIIMLLFFQNKLQIEKLLML